MNPIPDFENDSSLTHRQKQRRREYYADREANIAKTSAWEKLNPDKRKINQARTRDRNREKIRAAGREFQRKWRRENPELAKSERAKQKEYMYEYVKKQSTDIRRMVIDAYGGKCACCGESQIEFLAIDHIFNDGGELRRNGVHSTGRTFYRQLVKEGFPQGRLQVLCHNCNAAKAYHGICPHELAAKKLIGIKVEPQRIYRSSRAAAAV